MKAYDTYKDSGIEWIGEIPKDWEVKKLKYVSSCNDEVLPETTDKEMVINYVEIGDVTLSNGIENYTELTFENSPSRARRIAKLGDVIISTVRTYLGAITRIDSELENLIVSTGFAVVRCKNIISPFLGYYVKSQGFIDQVISLSTGVSYPSIASTQLMNIEISVPRIKEQTAIANYLDTKTTEIDQTIADKEALIDLYEEEKKALINEAVTKGKGLPAEASAKAGLNPNVKLKPSGIDWLGDIPEHWEVKKLKYLVEDRLMYGANESAEFDNVDFPRYIRITDFGDDGMLRDDTFKSLPYDVAKDYFLKEGDVLFARSGATVGKTFQFKGYQGLACFAGYLIKATPDKNKMLSDWLYYFTKSGLYENWKNSIFNQATIQNIGADKYNSLMLPVCKVEEQTAIVQYIEIETANINDKINLAKQEIELLKEYRQALIFEAVTGKICVL